MREKITKNRNTILMVLLILILTLFNIGMRYLATRPRYKTLPEVRLVNQKEESTKGFAIMVPNESGDGYVEYEGDTWPTEYKYVEAKCIDNDGEIVENAVTFKDGKVELQTDKTVYCTLYFSNKPFKSSPTIDILRAKDINGNLSPDIQGGMYRYQGTDNVPNWICFGTDNKEQCTDAQDSDSDGIPDGIDKYMYRIIGITENGQLYLIKETFLNKSLPWNSGGDSVALRCASIGCSWIESDIFLSLNGMVSESDLMNTFLGGSGDSGHDQYLNSGTVWYELIEYHDWLYGDVYWVNHFSDYDAESYYRMESGLSNSYRMSWRTYGGNMLATSESYVWVASAMAKVSLMYIHDYYFSFYDGSSESSRGKAKSETDLKKTWLFYQKDGYNKDNDGEWLSTRFGPQYDSPSSSEYATSANSFRTYAYYINRSGSLYAGALSARYGSRPVFYLSSKAKIASGDGTKESPYILSVQ